MNENKGKSIKNMEDHALWKMNKELARWLGKDP